MRVRLLARLYARAAILSLPALVCLVLLVHQRDDSHVYDTVYPHSSVIESYNTSMGRVHVDIDPIQNIRPLEYSSDITISSIGGVPSSDISKIDSRGYPSIKQPDVVNITGWNRQELQQDYSKAHSSNPFRTVYNLSVGRSDLCGDVAPPRNIPFSEKFQEIFPERSYVFSAYMDLRGTIPLVRVIGISDFHRDGHPRWCRVWYPGEGRADMVRVRDDIVPETHGTR